MVCNRSIKRSGFKMRVVVVLAFMAAVAIVSLNAVEHDAHNHAKTNSPKPQVVPARPGTIKMAEKLAEAFRKTNPMNTRFLNREKALLLKSQLEKTSDLQTELAIRPALGRELLNSGESREALQEFEKYETLLNQSAQPLSKTDRELLLRLKALCFLRLGEQLNCLSNHNADSCVFPIRGKGIHLHPNGSQNAIKILEQTLEEFPQNQGARWLLNIGYMTLGQYPEKVPAKWLVPTKLFSSSVHIPRFQDVAPGLGLAVNRLSGGVITEDLDGDGDLDIASSSLGFSDPLLFYRNNGDGTFTDVTHLSGTQGLTGGLNMVHADYDNDGRIDILVLRGAWMAEEGRHPNSLLRNLGNGLFEDVTISAGLLSYYPTQTATWFDYNNDGWIDLFIGNESVSKSRHPSELFRNNGDGTFTECAVESGLKVEAVVKGVASGDYNNDGRPDLYVSILGKPNMLFRNEGPSSPGHSNSNSWKFTEVALAAGVRQPIHSFPTWFFDFDNDGWEDLWVSGYRIAEVDDVAADYLGLPNKAERPRLYRNQRDGTFKDVTREFGLYKVIHAMGSNFGDLDNDGYLDFYIGTGDPDMATLIPNRVFKNEGGTRFEEVTYSGGFGNLQKGHAVAFADFDHDGDHDIFVDMGGAYAGDIYPEILYENPGNENGWICFKLVGTKSNRSAIGAKIRVQTTSKGQSNMFYRTVNSGGSFGASSFRQTIGLGAKATVMKVEILWPGSSRWISYGALGLRQLHQIEEGNQTVTSTTLKVAKFKSDPAHRHEHH